MVLFVLFSPASVYIYNSCLYFLFCAFVHANSAVCFLDSLLFAERNATVKQTAGHRVMWPFVVYLILHRVIFLSKTLYESGSPQLYLCCSTFRIDDSFIQFEKRLKRLCCDVLLRWNKSVFETPLYVPSLRSIVVCLENEKFLSLLLLQRIFVKLEQMLTRICTENMAYIVSDDLPRLPR